MNFLSSDGRFNLNIEGGKFTLDLNLKGFKGEFAVKELPQQLSSLQDTLVGLASSVAMIADIASNALRKKDEQGE